MTRARAATQDRLDSCTPGAGKRRDPYTLFPPEQVATPERVRSSRHA